MRDKHSRTPEKKELFLKELKRCGAVLHAAHAAKVGRHTVYDWRKKDKAFAQAWDDVIESAIEALERSMYQRAMDLDYPYATTAAIFLLKSMRPEKYRERFVAEHTGPNGVPIMLPGIPLRKIQDPDRLESVLALAVRFGLMDRLAARPIIEAEATEPKPNGTPGSEGNGSPA